MAKKTTKTSAKEEVEVKETKTSAKTTKAKVDDKKVTATKVASKSVENNASTKKPKTEKADVKDTKSVKKDVKSAKANETKKEAPILESAKKKNTDSTSKGENEVNETTNIVENTVAPEPKPKVAATPSLDKSVQVKSDNNPDLTTVKYSDDDLDMFASVITEAKTEALDELRMLKERLEDLTSFDSGEESMIYSMHMAEQGSEAQEKEKTYAQIQRISEHIKKLEDAMERIRNKTYGICRVCGCLIAKERLLAVPVTTLSAAYKIHSKCPDDGIDKIEPVKI
jgi:DnaK suppressor protein